MTIAKTRTAHCHLFETCEAGTDVRMIMVLAFRHLTVAMALSAAWQCLCAATSRLMGTYAPDVTVYVRMTGSRCQKLCCLVLLVLAYRWQISVGFCWKGSRVRHALSRMHPNI